MRLLNRVFGAQHTHEGSGGQLRRPRLYEAAVTAGFLGFRRRVFDGLVALSGAAPGDRVLDVGCGTGYLTRRVAHAVGPDGAVVGIDPSEPMVRYARRASPAHCRFHVAGAEAVPEPDGSFDVVVTSFAVHHIPPDRHPAAFREMRRVLRPGGRVLIADFRPGRGHGPVGVAGHRIAADTVDRVTALVTDAGLRVTGTGTRRPRLYYLQCERP